MTYSHEDTANKQLEKERSVAQLDFWDQEHAHPLFFKHLDNKEESGGVRRFWAWLQENDPRSVRGVEMGCGKGRNSEWLSGKGAHMTAFDISQKAIDVAKERAVNSNNPLFLVHDATTPWPFSRESFDFVIDCFASIDIPGDENRRFVRSEIRRVLKPGGFLFMYTNTNQSELFQELAQQNKVSPTGDYQYPNVKKFEKVYSPVEVEKIFAHYTHRLSETYDRYSNIGEKIYRWNHLLCIYQKPK